MPGWVVWAIAAVALALGELATPGLFFLGPVALAAIPAGIAALVGAPAWLQLLLFILGSLASLGVLRPVARAHLHMPALTRTGAAALVGQRAVVLQRVDANGGRVRIASCLCSRGRFASCRRRVPASWSGSDAIRGP